MYGTRSSNIDRNPGLYPGLQWQQDKADDERRVADSQAKVDEAAKRKATRTAQQQREEAGSRRLATLEDARYLEEREEEAYLKRTTASRYQLRCEGASSAPTTIAGAPMEVDDRGIGHPGFRGASAELYEDRGDEYEDSGSEDDETQPSQVRRKVRRREEVLEKISRSRRLNVEGAHSPSVKTPTKRPTEDVEGGKRPPMKPAVSAFNDDWSPISTPASRASSVAHPPSSSNSRPSSVSRTPSRAGSQALSFATGNWKSVLLGKLGMRATLHGAGGLEGQVSQGSKTSKSGTVVLEEEEIGGLQDDDIEVAPPTGTSDSVGSWSTSIVEFHGEVSSLTKSKRTAKKDVPEDQSLSADNLPAWIKPAWPQISASLCAFYGAEQNPWMLDRNEQDPAHIDNVFQVLVDALCPEKHYVVDSSDQAFKVARQTVYNWRCAFANSARAAVHQAVKARHGNPQQATKDSVAAWAKTGNSHGGEAHWGKPDT
ncbi:hypothetical protein BD311DRAFT_809325 [Dichomitus squalens]|uniref:Uncharacterized protein n=1 Tax=Dichomitus squalens TaxID=114155 RepID=A0A4Q9MEY4_9APHY|nr:hypothetical protein BD311DRAFT_809325 [Dichomitus squalens]